MVKRRAKKATKRVKVGGRMYVCKPTAASRVKFKKCILTAIRGTKITTRKGAQKAFRAAAKKCGGLLSGVKPRKGGRRKSTKRKTTRGRRVRGLPTGWAQRSTRGVSRRRLAGLPAGTEKYFGG
jgi:hypothetical protein